MLPSVAFLKPTGMLSPLAICRWVCLSVVRAPMVAQETSPAMYCGTIGSRNSVPAYTPHAADLEEQRAGSTQAGRDVEGIVEARIVDEALPSDGGARLLEVDAHDYQQAIVELAGQTPESAGVLDRGRLVVDRARPDYRHEALVFPFDDPLDLGPAVQDRPLDLGGDRKLLDQLRRSDQRLRAADANVSRRCLLHWAVLPGSRSVFLSRCIRVRCLRVGRIKKPQPLPVGVLVLYCLVYLSLGRAHRPFTGSLGPGKEEVPIIRSQV